VRLGEILVHAGVIDGDQLEAALRQQVVYGGRIGTNLIELGYTDADQIARALAHQYGVPAALRRQLGRHDPAVLALVPRELAAGVAAVPIAYSQAGGSRRLVVCMRDPGDQTALRDIAASAQVPVIPCVAPELLVYALLERLYHIPSPRRLATTAHGQARPVPHSGVHPIPRPRSDDGIDIVFDDEDDSAPLSMQLVDLDDEGVARDLSQYAQATSRNTQEIAAGIWAAASAAAGAEVADDARANMVHALAAASQATQEAADLSAIGPPDLTHNHVPATPVALPLMSVDEARATVASADHRDDVQQTVLAFMRGRFGGGLAMLAKDGLALGAAGFGGLFDEASVESILVPLSLPSMLAIAHDTRTPFRGPPPAAGHAVQDRFFKLFPLPEPPRDTIVAPVVIRDRVVCLYYAHAPDGGDLDGDAVDGLCALAADAADAYVRMIRGGKRKPE